MFKIGVNILNINVNNDNGKTILDTYGIKNILLINPIILISYIILTMIGKLDKNDIKLIFIIDVFLLFSLNSNIKYEIVNDKINPV